MPASCGGALSRDTRLCSTDYKLQTPGYYTTVRILHIHVSFPQGKGDSFWELSSRRGKH